MNSVYLVRHIDGKPIVGAFQEKPTAEYYLQNGVLRGDWVEDDMEVVWFPVV